MRFIVLRAALLSACLSSSFAATWTDCVPSQDFPLCLAPEKPLSSQRVRREIRTLSNEEWDRIVDAMWIMKTETMDRGQELYGDKFRTYDYFVVRHAIAATDTRGDQGHRGAHFINWHTAFVLEFENVLMTIDPLIEALPYWDETISEPSVFSEDYFGIDPDNSTSYEITTGRFANWPIDVDFSIGKFSQFFVNSSTIGYAGGGSNSSILRAADNTVVSPFATRYGSGRVWEATVNSTDDWWACTANELEQWNDWYRCMEQGVPSYHSGPHQIVGGNPRDGSGLRGDFEDRVTSPNGPIFMFHHANLDRNRLWWMRKHNSVDDVCSYYGFPVSDAPIIGPRVDVTGMLEYEGVLLNDIVSSAWGYTAAQLGLDLDTFTGDGDQQLTHADLICWIGPTTAQYTYDTNAACLKDSTECIPLQGEIPGPSSSPTIEPLGLPVPSTCASFKACFLLNMFSGVSEKISPDSISQYTLFRAERYSVFCTLSDVGEINKMEFFYEGELQHTEYEADWFMGGNSDNYIGAVEFLGKDCGSRKMFTVVGSVWEGECFRQEFELQSVCG